MTFLIPVKKIKYFGIFVCFGLIYEACFLCLQSEKELCSHVYCIFILFYFSYFYHSSFQSDKAKGVLYIVFLLNTLSVIILYIKSDYKSYNQILILSLCVYLVFLALLYFVDMILIPRKGKLQLEFSFWVSLGLLIWSILLIFNIGSIYYLNHTDPSFLKILQISFYATNVVVYVIYLYGMISIWRIDNKKT